MKSIYLLLVLSVSLTLAQTRLAVEPVNQAVLPQGIRWQALSANGFSHNFPTTLSQISGSNPAGLNNFDTLAFGISYQYDTEIRDAYILETDYKHNFSGLPQSIALVYPHNKKWTFGLSVAQKYNAVIDFDMEIPVTTEENLEGTLVDFGPKYQTNIYSFSALVAYDMASVLNGLGIAFRYNLDNFWIRHKIIDSEWKGNDIASSYAVGLSYKVDSDFIDFELATFYEQGVNIEGTLDPNQPSLLVAIDSDSLRGDQFYPIDPIFKTIVILPNRWHLGANINSEYGNLLADFTLIDWKSTGTFKNVLEFSTSYGYQVFDNLFLSVGIYSTDRRVIEEERLYAINNLKGFFLTYGAKTTFMRFDIDLAIADSHTSSDSWREQTIVKIAIGKSF